MSHIRKRLSKPLEATAVEYTSSLSFDRRLYYHDITGSIAHATMLAKQDIISPEEAEAIKKGLLSIMKEIEKGV